MNEEGKQKEDKGLITSFIDFSSIPLNRLTLFLRLIFIYVFLVCNFSVNLFVLSFPTSSFSRLFFPSLLYSFPMHFYYFLLVSFLKLLLLFLTSSIYNIPLPLFHLLSPSLSFSLFSLRLHFIRYCLLFLLCVTFPSFLLFFPILSPFYFISLFLSPFSTLCAISLSFSLFSFHPLASYTHPSSSPFPVALSLPSLLYTIIPTALTFLSVSNPPLRSMLIILPASQHPGTREKGERGGKIG